MFREAVFPKPRFRGWEAFLLVRLVVRGRLSNIGKPELAIFLDVVNRALRDVRPRIQGTSQEELRHHPNVAEYRLGVYGEGENGVTIAKLK